MEDQVIYEKLTAIFRDVMDDDAIALKPETKADDIAQWNSINLINIMIAVQMSFGIKFMSAEIEEPKNVGEFVQLIKARVAAK